MATRNCPAPRDVTTTATITTPVTNQRATRGASRRRRTSAVHSPGSGTGISFRSRLKRSRRSDDMDPSLAHARQRVRERRRDRPAPDTQQLGDLLLVEVEVVIRDDDRALSFGEESQELADADAVEDGVELVGAARMAPAEESEQQPVQTTAVATRGAQRDAEEPAGDVLVRAWRAAQRLDEGVVQRIRRQLAIEQGRYQGAIHARVGAAVHGRPSIGLRLGLHPLVMDAGGRSV